MLSINTTPASITIKTNNAKLEIQQPKAEIDMSVSPSSLDIKTEKPVITIDQSECFSEAGRKNIRQFLDDIVSYANEKHSEGIARRVDDGNILAGIEKGYNGFKENAKRAINEETSIGLDFIPKSRPVITITPGELSIRYNSSKVNFDVIPQKPIIDYRAGSVDIEVGQYPSIRIEYINDKIDEKV